MNKLTRGILAVPALLIVPSLLIVIIVSSGCSTLAMLQQPASKIDQLSNDLNSVESDGQQDMNTDFEPTSNVARQESTGSPSTPPSDPQPKTAALPDTTTPSSEFSSGPMGSSMTASHDQITAPMDSPPPSTQGPIREQFSSRPQVVGSEFRSPALTATEIMIQLRDQNTQMREAITSLKQTGKRMQARYEAQLALQKKTNAELRKSQKLNSQYRTQIASLEVRVDRLNKAKLAIEKETEKVLGEIENNLNDVFLHSMSTMLKK